jgi:hypothetical protein
MRKREIKITLKIQRLEIPVLAEEVCKYLHLFALIQQRGFFGLGQEPDLQEHFKKRSWVI